MALITQTKEGRKDGGYSRLFGVDVLGSLFSRVHATVIRSGNDLENALDVIIEKRLNKKQFNSFKKGDFSECPDTFFLCRRMTKQMDWFEVSEPDYVYFSLKEKKIFVIELKDGDAFDTKKSLAELKVLQDCVRVLSEREEFKEFEIDYRFCSFNCTEKNEVCIGTKGLIPLDHAFTGLEFCDLMKIDFECFRSNRGVDSKANMRFFLKSLIEIKCVRSMLISLLLDKKSYAKEVQDKLQKVEF